MVLGDIRHMVASHDADALFRLCLLYPSDATRDVALFLPFCIIAVNSLTYLRTTSLAFVRAIPCVYIDIISFSASPTIPGLGTRDPGHDGTRHDAALSHRTAIGT